MDLRSSIKTSLKRHALFKGTLFASLGAFLILYGGIFVPVAELTTWGLPLLLAGGTLITLGLRPYQRLSYLERKPNVLTISQEDLQFTTRGKLTLTIPWVSIEKITYVESRTEYGIRIHLKHPLPEKIMVHNPRFNSSRFQKDSRKKQQCDLFFPYFSRNAYKQLSEHCSG